MIDDARLFSAARQGDAAATKAVFDRYAPWMYGLFRMLLPRVRTADAGVANVLAAAVRRSEELEAAGPRGPGGPDVRTWLAEVALEQLPSVRPPRPSPRPAEATEALSSDELDALGERALSALVRILEPASRRALVFGVLQPVRRERLAAAFGCSVEECQALVERAVGELGRVVRTHLRREAGLRVAMTAANPYHLRPKRAPASDGMIVVRGGKAYVDTAPGRSLAEAVRQVIERFLERLRRTDEYSGDDEVGGEQHSKTPDPTPTVRPIEKPKPTPSLREYKAPKATPGIGPHRAPRGTPSTARLSSPRRPLGSGARSAGFGSGWTRN